MDYSAYKVADFVADEYFEKWVNRPDLQAITFWEEWIAAHPKKKPVVEEAKRIIWMMRFNDAEYSKEEAHSLLMRIHTTLNKKNNTKTLIKTSLSTENKVLQKGFSFWYKIAAGVFLCMAGIGGYLSFQGNNHIRYTTSFGEKKIIILPDSSKVILNANSTLSYNPHWSNEMIREVTLQGEAFFEVRKAPYAGANQFEVHTQQVKVEVLGTQFNVSEREGTTIVTLNEGTIKLNGERFKDVIMEPGEQAELTDENSFEIRQVNPVLYTSWKDNKLVFEETSIQEIATTIEHTYGMEVNVVDTAIFQRKFTGTLPGDNIDIILKTLSQLYQIEIECNENEIFLHTKK